LKYFFSIGNVAKPTMVNVVIKAAIAVKLAPLTYKDFESGKAIKAGMMVIVPIAAPHNVLINSFVFPSKALIELSGMIAKNQPIIAIIPIISISISFIIKKALFKVFFVFGTSFLKDQARKPVAPNISKIVVKIFTSVI
jgi:hypothetical protein